MLREEREAYERKVLDNIERFGCHVTSVFSPDDEAPPFSYSIGIARTCGAPELIVLGLDAGLGSALVNDYHDRVVAGERFAAGSRDARFLEDHEVTFISVSRDARAHYMPSACWLHGGPDFEALQLVWPDENGAWPWDAHATEGFLARQPLLS